MIWKYGSKPKTPPPRAKLKTNYNLKWIEYINEIHTEGIDTFSTFQYRQNNCIFFFVTEVTFPPLSIYNSGVSWLSWMPVLLEMGQWLLSKDSQTVNIILSRSDNPRRRQNKFNQFFSRSVSDQNIMINLSLTVFGAIQTSNISDTGWNLKV